MLMELALCAPLARKGVRPGKNTVQAEPPHKALMIPLSGPPEAFIIPFRSPHQVLMISSMIPSFSLTGRNGFGSAPHEALTKSSSPPPPPHEALTKPLARSTWPETQVAGPGGSSWPLRITSSSPHEALSIRSPAPHHLLHPMRQGKIRKFPPARVSLL